MKNSTFTKYEHAIRTYQGNPLSETLLMARDGALSVYYAPFEWVNPDARVVLVGITPGKVQAANALAEARGALLAGKSIDEVLRRAKRTGAFSGAMRPNLINLLDCIGLHKWLNIGSCAELFGNAGQLLQTASALQFPVFIDGANYNGTPDPLKNSLLRSMLLEHFGTMVKAVPNAVFVPLGPVPSKALEWLAQQGVLPASRVLHGLPHPSGANAERIAYFLGRKKRSELSVKTTPEKLDSARERLTKDINALSHD